MRSAVYDVTQKICVMEIQNVLQMLDVNDRFC